MVTEFDFEHERKFLLKEDSVPPSKEGTSIIQGYLGAQDGFSVRVRIYPTLAVYQITVKGPGDLTRLEEEDAVSRSMGEALFQACGARIIEKTRHSVLGPDGKGWDIDVFHGPNSGLRIAELELASPDETFVVPDWCREEVTGDKRYYNEYLADHPYKSWALDG